MLYVDKEGRIYQYGKLACEVVPYKGTMHLRVLNPHGIVGFTVEEAQQFSGLVAQMIKEMEVKKGVKKSKIVDPDGAYVCQKCKGAMHGFMIERTIMVTAEVRLYRDKTAYATNQTFPAKELKVEIHCPFCKKSVGKAIVDDFKRRYLNAGATGD